MITMKAPHKGHCQNFLLLFLQMTIQSGFTPTVLQQLCNLPIQYFSEERLTAVLLPTLLACCWENAETRAVLEQEIGFDVSIFITFYSFNFSCYQIG
jgi:hypothetical protein